MEFKNIEGPLVSVIVPSYNYGLYLPETFDNMIGQSYNNWECVVIDDGSTDNTEQVVSSYMALDNRFKYIKQKNQGTSPAKNTGIEIARGKYIQFQDADDLFEKDKLKNHVHFLESNPAIDLVYGDAKFFTDDDKAARWNSLNADDQEWMPKISGKGNKILERLIDGNIMTINAPLIRRELIDKIGLFKKEMKYCEDFEYWVRMALANAHFFFHSPPQTACLIRIHKKSASNNHAKMVISYITTVKQIEEKTEDITIQQLVRKKLEESKSQLLYLYSINQGTKEEISYLYEDFPFLKSKFLPLIPKKWRYNFLAFGLTDYFRKLYRLIR